MVVIQYVLTSLAFIATLIGISAGVFPKARKAIAIIAFLVAVGVLSGNIFLLNAETVSSKEARCEYDISNVVGLMSVKERVRRGVAWEMLKVDSEEVTAQNRVQRFPSNLETFEFERRLHFALGGKILSKYMGNADTSYEKFLNLEIMSREKVGKYGCQLNWNSPPSGTFSCQCSLFNTVRF